MGMSHRELRRIGVGLLFAAPWLLGFLAFTVYPSMASLYYSFTSFNTLQAPVWVGLDNFSTLFGNDALFWTAVGNTLYFTAIGVPVSIATALGLALLLNRPRRGVTVYRALIYIPAVVPPVVTAIIWVWILNPENGLLNGVLGLLRLPQPGWLTDPSWSKPALLIMFTWTLGQTMVILLAGLQDVPAHLHEAAMIDGAGALRRFWHVTIPQLAPTFLFVGVVTMIGYFQLFAEPYVMTGGGPLRATTSLVLFMYEEGFRWWRMGVAAAIAFVLFGIILLWTLVQMRLQRERA